MPPDMNPPKPFRTRSEYLDLHRHAYGVIDELGAIGPLWNSELEARQACQLFNDLIARGWRAREAAMKERADA